MKHILIVDDDRTTVRLLTMLLEMDGFRVSQTPLPEVVLESSKGAAFDAYIIDCNLAGYSGLELLKSIRADGELAGVPVIMTSGKDLSREAEEAGASYFLLKPFSPSELTSRLSELVG